MTCRTIMLTGPLLVSLAPIAAEAGNAGPGALPTERAARAAEHARALDPGQALAWTLHVALVLAAVHVLAPRPRALIEPRSASVGSLGSGMAIAHVFVHLLPELDRGHAALGERIHLVVLVGFVVFYAPEHALDRSEGEADRSRGRKLVLPVATAWVYGWLILYALPESLASDGAALATPIAALVLHCAFADFHLGHEHRGPFDRWGRWALATAPLAGWATDLVARDDDPLVSDVLIALLAGSVLYDAFRRELPDHRAASLRWFLVGVAAYVLLDLVLGRP